MTWIVPKKRLSPSQEVLIELPIDEHRLITGAPGSGKTIVLAYRAKYMLQNLKIKKDKLKIFVYTNSLVRFIKSGIVKIDIPEDCVSTFSSWCLNYYKENIGHIYGSPDYDMITFTVANHLTDNKVKPIYDCVLVDEGQDLNEDAYRVFRRIAKHITVCADEKQQIYENGISLNDIAKTLNIDINTNRYILENWRCTPYIAELAANFINDEDERLYFLNQTMRDDTEGEVPYIATSSDYRLLTEKFIDVLKDKITDANINSIGIIVPQKRVGGGVAKTLEQNNIKSEISKNVDFDTTIPKIMPYHSAKGLTFDAVFLPSVDDHFFDNWDYDLIKRMMFVGISRAVKFVYIHFRSDHRLPVFDNLEELHDEGIIYLQDLDDDDNEKGLNKLDDDDDLYL